MKTELARESYVRKNLLKYVGLVVFVALVVFTISKSMIFTDFSTEQILTLVLLVFAVYLWVATPIPTSASSILLLALMLLFNIVESVDEAFIGFLSPALYFVFILSLISQVLVKVGIDQVIAHLFFKLSKGGPRAMIIGLPFFMLLLPLLLPSAVARFKMLLPLMNQLNHFYGYPEKSIFQKYSLFIIGMMNQNATMIIFTGGAFPVLASQLVRDYRVANFDWLDWVLMVAPPLWLGSLLLVLFVWNFLKFSMPNEMVAADLARVDLPEKNEPLSAKAWVVLISFLLMIVVWIVADQEYVPLLLPPMLLVVLYSLPQLGLVTNKMVRSYDWENFLLLGASFSLGMLIAENGTAEALANLLIGVIPENSSIGMKVIIIAVIVFVLRFFFTVPSSAVIVIFPIVISYSQLIGLPPVQLAFLVVLVIGSMMMLPIHSTVTYLAYETGIFSKKEQYIIGAVSSILFLVIAILSALYFW